MNKTKHPNYVLIFIFLFSLSGTAQIFTWMNGSSSFNQAASYGMLGSPSSSNTPGARVDPATWKDSNGNFWLFGGMVPTGSLTSLVMNDLWKFNVSNNQWVWMHGSTQVCQYGTSIGQGMADPSNTPGSRRHAISWTDASGNLWLYGGVGYGVTNTGDLRDLWKYDIASGMWTCVNSGSGSQYSVYGTLGVSAASNKLGSRRGAASWVDLSGNLWLFGGLGFDSAHTYSPLNEVWRYSTVNQQWTWMGGSKIANQNGNYGSLGVPSNVTMPGGRSDCAWSSDAYGNLLLFGGAGYDGSSPTVLSLNDLWKYTISTNQWTWIGGSNLNSQTGVYGTLGVSSPSNMPGGRSSSAFWTNASGKFYIFGGHGFSSSIGNELNDLWEYNPGSNEWTWLHGSNLNGQFGNYGTQGVPSPSNIPGARSLMASWQDNFGNLWLFGGYTPTINALTYYSDMWKLSFCTATPPLITASSSSNMICSGESATLNASGAVYYSWNGMPTGTSSSLIITPAVTSTFVVTGMDNNSCSNSAQLVQIVNPLPSLTLTSSSNIICSGESATLTVSGANTYSWTGGGSGTQLITNPLSTTIYTVTGTTNACNDIAIITQSVSACAGIELLSKNALQKEIYPNPSSGVFYIPLENELLAELSVFDLNGRLVFSSKIMDLKNVIDLSNKVNGIYFVEIKQGGKVTRSKIVKM